MQGSDVIKLALFVTTLLLSALFSASEAAYLSIQRGRLAYLMKSAPEKYRRVHRLATHPERLLPTVLTGNNLVNTAAAALGTSMALSLLESPNAAVIASTGVVTILLLVFGETLPKAIATRHPVGVATAVIVPLNIVEIIMLPPIWLLEKLIKAVARLLGVQQAGLVSEGDIRALIDLGQEEGVVESTEADMLHQVFRFGDQQLREIITPRTEIVGVEKGARLEEFLNLYQQHSHTRFPVFEGSLDNILGTVSVKDVVRAMAAGEIGPQDDVTSLLRPAYFVPEAKPVGELFREIKGSGYQMVIAADEFGGVAGLATVKQMIEQIVGPVGEEGVQEEEEFQVIDTDIYQLDAGMSLEEVNARLPMNIPQANYETVAGFMLARLGHIPKQGERVYHNGFLLEVAEMRGVKIEQIKVTRAARPSRGESQ